MTLKKIAEMTGTSVSTVSRVLNQTSPTCASRELQDRIWEAARETGYRPNEAARSLRRAEAQETGISVSVVLARISSLGEEPFFAELFRCLEIELMKRRATIEEIVYAKDSLPERLAPSDGVIILGRCSASLLNHILAQNRNAVGIWRNPVDFNIDEVICDGQKAAETALAYLFSLGHRKIAYIGSCSYESRYVGYCNMLIRSNIPIDYALIRQTDQSRGQAESAFLELLQLRREGKAQFSAIFCANDNTAVRVLELMQEHCREIRPGTVSVISIDDIEEAQNTRPYLTTVHIPRAEMAHMAVMLLLDRIKGGHREVVRNEFPCRIVKRESCTPVIDSER